ncbi:MAG: fused MFS/spermidine synthase [Phycisphaerales bacterium]|nr:fused MFS/spermidine synthase [Phycisphaerales bacterium]
MLALYSAAIFLGATLLFMVQPMIGKMILPTLGGSPAVWNTCMLFFQATLLAGYLYAHGLGTRKSKTLQMVVHAVVLALPILTLPFALPAAWAPSTSQSPALAVLSLLTVIAAAPICVMATTGPLLQKWFSMSSHRHAKDPYFLYAASNLGSFTGLLAYPLLLEPSLTLKQQATFWAYGYGVYAVVAALCGVMVLLKKSNQAPDSNDEPDAASASCSTSTGEDQTPTWTQRLKWLGLSAAPAALMISVTQHIATDVASAPMLWVVPLGIYLLSFVIVYSPRMPRVVPVVCAGLFIVLAFTAAFNSLSALISGNVILLALHLSLLFFGCCACHARLAAARPGAKRLTEYYLLMAVGGVLAGGFCSLVAPVIFNSIFEYPIAIASCVGLATPLLTGAFEAVHRHVMKDFDAGSSDAAGADADDDEVSFLRRHAKVLDVLFPAIVLAVFASMYAAAVPTGTSQGWGFAYSTLVVIFYVIPVLLSTIFLFRPLRAACAVLGLFTLANVYITITSNTLYSERTFFGVHVVAESTSATNLRTLRHGTTSHGLQAIGPDGTPDIFPTSYYHLTGPLGITMRRYQTTELLKSVAVAGLGTGCLASYARPGDRYTFFEIDPAVIRIAQDPELFTFVSKSSGKLDFVLGDARLTIAQAPDASFGVIVLDAFSSDAIPVHLITTDALRAYLPKLKPNGLLLVHISNRKLNLEPVMAAAAKELNLAAVTWFDSNFTEQNRATKSASHWVVLARSMDDLKPLTSMTREERAAFSPRNPDAMWRPLVGREGFRPWTDDYSNLLSVIEW